VNDFGLVCAPYCVVKEEIKTGKLIPLELEAEPVSGEVSLFYLPTNYSSNIKLMADYLKEHSI
jgi:DNA-binding transcriptional LysR family regulator